MHVFFSSLSVLLLVVSCSEASQDKDSKISATGSGEQDGALYEQKRTRIDQSNIASLGLEGSKQRPSILIPIEPEEPQVEIEGEAANPELACNSEAEAAHSRCKLDCRDGEGGENSSCITNCERKYAQDLLSCPENILSYCDILNRSLHDQQEIYSHMCAPPDPRFDPNFCPDLAERINSLAESMMQTEPRCALTKHTEEISD